MDGGSDKSRDEYMEGGVRGRKEGGWLTNEKCDLRANGWTLEEIIWRRQRQNRVQAMTRNYQSMWISNK